MNHSPSNSDSIPTTKTNTAVPKPSKPRSRRRLVLAAILLGGSGVAAWALARERAPVVLHYEIVNEYPHDPQAFCQGLVFDNGFLYEGTGQYGKSSLRQVDLESGKVLHKINLNRRIFGEGITIFNGQIIQLTWKSHIGIVYDQETFTHKKQFPIEGQGWGITHDTQHLIVSDGSSTLRFLDPNTYQVVRKIPVSSQGRFVKDLNELEFIDGEIWANVWTTDVIARIDPQSGQVKSWINLSGLKPRAVRRNRDAVLNGIAYDADQQRIFVTGKNWPTLFEIRVAK